MRPSSRPTASFGPARDFSKPPYDASPSLEVSSLAPGLDDSSLPPGLGVSSVPPTLELSGSTPAIDAASASPRRTATNAFVPLDGGPRRSRARSIVAKLLFITLFASVATLLGFALKKKLETARSEDALGFFARTR